MPKAVSRIMATCLSSSQYGEVFARDVHCLPTCLLYVLNYFRIKFQPQKTLKAFSIQIWNLKKSLFADDASFILDGSFKSFQTLIDILDNFSYISGLKIDAKKCQVLRIGSMTKSNVVYLKDRKFQWSSTEASSLGMTFGTNKENIF